MYIDFFGFRDKPFRLTPESAAFYCSDSHDRAMTMLEYGINSRKGFMLLHGMPGTGRTTLCFLLRETLVNCNVVYIPKVYDNELLIKICKGFGLNPSANSSENEIIGLLIDFFVSEYKSGKNNLIITDDADEYSVDTFRTLEKLTEVEIEQCKLVQILLVGTQDLCSKLMYGDIKSLGERILLATELTILSLNDTANYLQHRLKYAKVNDPDLIKRTAVVEIYRYSHGLPLEINLVADKAFEVAASAKDKRITPKHIKRAVQHISGIREPLRVYTLAQYILPVLFVLIVLLFGLQIKTWYNMKYIEKQYTENIQPLPNSTQSELDKLIASSETEEPIGSIDTPPSEIEEPKQVQELEPVIEKPVEINPPVADTPLVIQPEPTPIPVASDIRYGCVTAQSGLNLRAVPSSAGRVVMGVMHLQRVKILENRDKWLLVEVNGSEGFLFSEYVKEIETDETCE
jgi:general secretion pathway protein A